MPGAAQDPVVPKNGGAARESGGYSAGTSVPPVASAEEGTSVPLSADARLYDRNASYSCLSGLMEESEEETEEEKPQPQAPANHGGTMERRTASYSKLRHDSHEYESKNLDVPVVVVASEAEPFSKSGGLGIVSAAYGYEFAMRGHRTMVVLPMYDDYPGATWLADKELIIKGETVRIKYYLLRKVLDESSGAATDFIFVQHDCFRRAGGLYHDEHGEFGDNLFRFGMFSLAALEAPLCCNINGSTYGDKCLFVANDWQAGLVPIMLAHKFRRHGTYKDARCIFVVHNMGYQGAYPWDRDHIADLGLPGEAKNDLFFIYPCHMRTSEFDKGECINLTKGALITCDRVMTVSRGYCDEIKTPEGGFLLQDVCHSKGIFIAGIQNGIDDTWDPKSDKKIAANFSADDHAGKKECKRKLQKSMGLDQDDNVAIVGFVGRLTWQKGIDILQEGVIDWLIKEEGNGVTGKVQVIMMGNGDAGLSDWLKMIEAANPGKVCGYAGFKPEVERDMMAGCDFLLMPSRYEPCGIPQMVALTYGTLPIVHATGGLKDSVQDAGSPDAAVQATANGYYVFPLAADKMKEVLWAALTTFHKDKDEHKRLMTNAMKCNFYWPLAIEEYEKHFDYTLADAPFYKV